MIPPKGPEFQPKAPDTTSPWYRIEATGLTQEQTSIVLDLISQSGKVYFAYSDSVNKRDVMLFTSKEEQQRFQAIINRTFYEGKDTTSPTSLRSSPLSQEEITKEEQLPSVVVQVEVEEELHPAVDASEWVHVSAAESLQGVHGLSSLWNRLFTWLNKGPQRDLEQNWRVVLQELRGIDIPPLKQACSKLLDRTPPTVPSREELISLLEILIKNRHFYPEVQSFFNEMTFPGATLPSDLVPIQQAILALPEQKKKLETADELVLSYRAMLHGISQHHKSNSLDAKQWNVVQARVNALLEGSTESIDKELRESIEEGLKDNRARIKALGLFISRFLVGREDLPLSPGEVAQAKQIIVDRYEEKLLARDVKTPTLRQMDSLSQQQKKSVYENIQAGFTSLQQAMQNARLLHENRLATQLKKMSEGLPYKDESGNAYRFMPDQVGKDISRAWEDAVTYTEKGRCLLDKQPWKEEDAAAKMPGLLDQVDQLCENPLNRLAMATATQAINLDCAPLSAHLRLALIQRGTMVSQQVSSTYAVEKVNDNTIQVRGSVVSTIQGVQIEETYSYQVKQSAPGSVTVSKLHTECHLLTPMTKENLGVIKNIHEAIPGVLALHQQSV